MTRQDLILATIRTGVPAAVGWLLAQLITLIPVIGNGIASIDRILATSAPGFTVSYILEAAAIGAVVAAYYWAVRKLGQRWPIVERFLLGSAKQPVAYSQPTNI
ncbi:hypothetical protein ACIGCK_04720 [Microbacterium sp. NPDC078428]|uniref:hypothetical protein n=1 Tax=Microbacterium sp. NPDC078428 TaxID=3364190 RepID=UPI0037C95A04